MNWFQRNRFLGSFLVAFGVATLLCGYFLLHEKGAAETEQERLDSTTTELNQLRAGKPFPNAANLAKMKAQAESYRKSLGNLEQELAERTLPVVPLQPSEFQAQLRQAVNAVTENAVANKVKLPANFYLGFDEYATSLPNSVAAPLLGQELQAVAMLANGVINAHVDALNGLTRTPLPQEKAAATPTPTASRRGPAAPRASAAATTGTVRAPAVELDFAASPSAARKVLNQIATAKEQLFIIRTLNVKNQADQGPKRDGAAVPAAPVTPEAGAAATPAPSGIKFIVGAEHLDLKVRVEIISLDRTQETR